MTIVIHSGLFRGMKLKSPEGVVARPTVSRVREAVLNALAPRLDGARVLDLFAGSGAFGIEALSRGAGRAVFVERDRHVLQALRLNLSEAERRAASQGSPAGLTRLCPVDLKACVQSLVQEGPYDIVWADPPYAEASQWAAFFGANARGLVAPDGILVLESAAKDAAAVAESLLAQDTLELERQKIYGITSISLWTLKKQ